MEIIFTFHNTHSAIEAERLLLKGGVKVKVMALPSCLGAGCGLCLRLTEGDFELSRALLSESAIETEAVYFKILDNGHIAYSLCEVR